MEIMVDGEPICAIILKIKPDARRMKNMPVTILEVAKGWGVKTTEDGNITMESINKVGLPFMGGCCICEASVACYNSYPTTYGFIMCRECVESEDVGFTTVEDFNIHCNHTETNRAKEPS